MILPQLLKEWSNLDQIYLGLILSWYCWNRKSGRLKENWKQYHSQVNLQTLNKQNHLYFSTLKLAKIEYNAKVLSLSYRDNPKASYHHVQRLSGDISPLTLPSKYSITELPTYLLIILKQKFVTFDLILALSLNYKLKPRVTMLIWTG